MKTHSLPLTYARIEEFKGLSPSTALALAGALAASRRAPLKTLFLALTYRCNLKCRHCAYLPARKAGRDMPLKVANRILTLAAETGYGRLVLFGGEPTLYRGLREITSAAARSGMLVQLDTNGQTLTPALIHSLAGAGLASVMVSLHSADRRGHEALAGKGTYARAVRAARACVRSGLLTYFSSCIQHGAASPAGISALARLAKAEGLHGLRVLPFAGTSVSGRDAQALRGLIAGAGLSAFARTCVRQGASACTAARGELLFMDPSGEVKSCPYALKSLGNFLKDGPGALRRRGRTAKAPCQK